MQKDVKIIQIIKFNGFIHGLSDDSKVYIWMYQTGDWLHYGIERDVIKE